MNAFIEEIRNTHPEEGQISAWWLGQMGYVFKTSRATILVDGFLSDIGGRLIPAPFAPEEAAIFDAVIGSHNHDDHVDKPAWKKIHEANPDTVFMAAEPHRSDIKADTGIDIIGLREGETAVIGDFTVDVIPAAHEFIETDANGDSLHLSFIINRRIFHCGDSCIYDGQRAKIAAFGKMEAMILPINGRDAGRLSRGCIGNMTYQEAVDLAGSLNPGMAIPGHYDMFRDNPGDPEAFRAYMNVKYPHINCVIPERFKEFKI